MTYGDSTAFYKRNPDKYIARKTQIQERKQRIRKEIQEYRKDKSCIRCGFADYRAIDFHHRDPAQKVISISEMAGKGWSWIKMQTELDKCDPLCRNCHAIFHAEARENALVV